MLKHMIHSLSLYFPTSYEKMVDCYDNGDNTLTIILNDGSRELYNCEYNSIRMLPKDSNTLTEKQWKREFGDRLRRRMHWKGVTQQDMAEKTGLSQATISSYISGKRTPSCYAVDKMTRVLKCSVDDLMYVEPYK